MSETDISVVIPTFNEEHRLPPTLESLITFLQGRDETWEIVIADDGSRDRTPEIVRSLGRGNVRLLRNDANRGKGHAVRRGMLAARGTWRLMSDADLSTPIDELDRLRLAVDAGCDVVVGSRAVQGARIEVPQPWFRENVGRLFNLGVRWLAVPGIHDTQCGFKLFNGPAAERVFRLCRLDGFSFDVEALFVARRLGLRVGEVPITWRNDAASRVTLLRGALAFLDLLLIRLYALQGRYGTGVGVL